MGRDKKPADKGLIVEYLAEISKERIRRLKQASTEALTTMKQVLFSSQSIPKIPFHGQHAFRLPDGNYVVIPLSSQGNSILEIDYLSTNGEALTEQVGDLSGRLKPVDTLDAIMYLGQIIQESTKRSEP